jgi:hypothetical protein
MPAADMVIKKQPEPQQPGGPEPIVVRQDKAKRPDDVGRDPPEDLPFDQRLADEAKLIIFEIA